MQMDSDCIINKVVLTKNENKMTQTRQAKRASERKAEKDAARPEVKVLKNAFIIPEEEGIKMFQSLSEIPIKYTDIVKPLLDTIQRAVRGDINVTTKPSIPPPPPEKPKPVVKKPAVKKKS